MKKILTLALFVSVLLPGLAYAQATGGTQPPSTGGTLPPSIGGTPPIQPSQPVMASLPNPLGDKVSSIPDLFYLLVNALLSVSYVVVAFFLIWSGFKFVAAQGEPDKLTDAKNTFKYTIIGALIIIGAQTIIAIVKSIITGLGIA